MALPSPRDVERILLQAQQEIGAGPRAAPEFVRFGGVDADAQTDALDGANAVFEMRKPLVRQTAEIDDVGAGSRHPERARNDRIDRQCRSVDDLGEDAHVVAREIDCARASAEENRQILQFVGSALEARPEFGRKLGQIRATTTGNNHPRRLDGTRQPASDDRLGHQRGDLYADVDDRPFKVRPLDPEPAPAPAAAGRDGRSRTECARSS